MKARSNNHLLLLVINVTITMIASVLLIIKTTEMQYVVYSYTLIIFNYSLFFNFGYVNGQQIITKMSGPESKESFIKNSIKFSLITIFLSLSFLALVPVDINLFLLITIIMVVNVYELYIQYLTTIGDSKIYLYMEIFYRLLLLVTIFFNNNNDFYYLKILIIIRILQIIFLSFYTLSKLVANDKKRNIIDYYKVGFLVTVSNFLFALLGTIDKILLYDHFSTKTIAIYMASYSLVMAASMINIPMRMIIFSKLDMKKNQVFDVLKYWTLGFVIGILGLIFSFALLYLSILPIAYFYFLAFMVLNLQFSIPIQVILLDAMRLHKRNYYFVINSIMIVVGIIIFLNVEDIILYLLCGIIYQFLIFSLYYIFTLKKKYYLIGIFLINTVYVYIIINFVIKQ